MLPFKHRDLNLQEKEIRLLRLHKTDDEAAPLRLSIRHAALDETLEFNALSYAWGKDPPSKTIVICDEDEQEGSFDIRENLHDFFVAARKFHEPWTTEWIWIDQICINQGHHEERCHQVAQMAELYSTAKATIVWPGVLPAPPEETPGSASLDLSMYEQLTHKFASREFDEVLLERSMRNWLPSLLLQPYWFRLWIIQEIVLASSVVIFLTHATCSFDHFKESLSRVRKSLENYPDPRGLHLFMGRVIDLGFMRYAFSNPSRLSWFHVLLLSDGTKFSEHLDRFYALMGLVQESRRFQPDYDLSRRDLLKKVFQTEIAPEKLEGRQTTADVLLTVVDRAMRDQSGPENREQYLSQKTENRRIAIDILTELGADIGNEMKELIMCLQLTQSFDLKIQ